MTKKLDGLPARVAALEKRVAMLESPTPSTPASIGSSWARCQLLARQRQIKHDAHVRKFFP